MLLPNGDKAVVELEKLRDYCLNPAHPVGKHKARVFASALDFTAADALTLRQLLLQAARTEKATDGLLDRFGQRYLIDFDAVHRGYAARVRSSWIILANEDFPRLVTCFVV
jgi:hypothetical protein